MANQQNTLQFRHFPKTRPELPESFKKIYAEYYKKNRDGATHVTSVSSRLEEWMHRQVASDLTAGAKVETLEIGAGTLNHLRFEGQATAQDTTQTYDVVEPFEVFTQDSPKLKQIRKLYRSLDEVPNDRQYDRIINIAVLEHLCDLPRLVAQAVLKLKDDGSFRAAIPSEGSLLWNLGWRGTTGLEFYLKYGLNYGTLMRHEHVNTWREIRDVLKAFFEEIEVKSFGIHPTLSLYQFYNCKKPKKEAARAYLESLT